MPSCAPASPMMRRSGRSPRAKAGRRRARDDHDQVNSPEGAKTTEYHHHELRRVNFTVMARTASPTFLKAWFPHQPAQAETVNVMRTGRDAHSDQGTSGDDTPQMPDRWLQLLLLPNSDFLLHRGADHIWENRRHQPVHNLRNDRWNKVSANASSSHASWLTYSAPGSEHA